jgi:hypothetical protein
MNSCCFEKQVNFQNVFNDFSISLGLASLFGGSGFPRWAWPKLLANWTA